MGVGEDASEVVVDTGQSLRCVRVVSLSSSDGRERVITDLFVIDRFDG